MDKEFFYKMYVLLSELDKKFNFGIYSYEEIDVDMIRILTNFPLPDNSEQESDFFSSILDIENVISIRRFHKSEFSFNKGYVITIEV